MLIAGGTDLLPNMKRRHQAPQVLVSLRKIEELKKSQRYASAPALTLTRSRCSTRRRRAALRQAAMQVATPHLRNMGTLGGNLCLDTRCNYYNQNYEWRKAIDFCLKKDGDICWVATASKRCVAVSSTDTAPALIALGRDGDSSCRRKASARSRRGPVQQRRHRVPHAPAGRDPDRGARAASGWKSTYWKLRRRGSFDFPILGVAAAVKFDRWNVEEARIALGAVASRPFLVEKAGEFLKGKKLTDEVIAEAAALVANRAPSRWTTPTWTSTGARKWPTISPATRCASCAATTCATMRLRTARQAIAA